MSGFAPGQGPEFSVSMTEAEWSVVLAALQEAPMALRLTSPVASKLHMQVRSQMMRHQRANGQLPEEPSIPSEAC